MTLKEANARFEELEEDGKITICKYKESMTDSTNFHFYGK